MYQPPYGYAQGAPGLAPGMSAPVGYGATPIIPPNFNFNAPVIHFGQTLSGQTTVSTAPATVSTANPVARPVIQPIEGPRLPPSAEDQLHSVFIGDIPTDLPDEWMERITRSLGKLKEWRRAVDGDDKPRPFGFAIFEDGESTNRGFRLLQGLVIPSTTPGKNGTKLTVRIDEGTTEYLQTLGITSTTSTDQDLNVRSYLSRVMEELKDPIKRQIKAEQKTEVKSEDKLDDIDEADYTGNAYNVLSTGGVEEDATGMPTADREVILKEIAAFRERSNRREKWNKSWFEEEEKTKSNVNGNEREKTPDTRRGNERRGDGERSIPSGPAAERRRGGRDFHHGVKFRSSSDRYDVDDDEDIPDEEIERRLQDKKRRDLAAAFADRERKWLSREKMRTSALEREMKRANAEDHVMDKEALLAWLSSFDDDREADLQKEEYYRDHQLWARKRVEFRRKEREKDERDREAESREVNKDRSRAAALADSFLEQQVFELVGAATKGPPAATSGFAQPLRLRMTRDAVKTTPASPAKRTVEEVEGLLEEDEEDDYQASSKKRRLLIPLEEEREEPRHPKQSNEEQIRNLVAEIPSDKEGLWKYPVYWEGMDDSILEGKIRPFATKKIIEAFGVQEQEIIDFVVDHISNRGSAEDLAKELEMTLDEEAEIFVKKMWRMLILETEFKKRKIAT